MVMDLLFMSYRIAEYFTHNLTWMPENSIHWGYR